MMLRNKLLMAGCLALLASVHGLFIALEEVGYLLSR